MIFNRHAFFYSLLVVVHTLISKSTFAQNFLVSYYDVMTDHCGFKDAEGRIVIEPQYQICFTDTLSHFAIVLKEGLGLHAINAQGEYLYAVYAVDNGPDGVSEGTFRITKDNKIGYADARTGRILIHPKFKCAFPFTKGTARVSHQCFTSRSGEHSTWESARWIIINKRGKKVKHLR